MLALRTSFVALVYDQDDPVLDDVIIWGGVNAPGTDDFERTSRRFSQGMTMSMACYVHSATDTAIHTNFTATWQKSVDEGVTWANIDHAGITRIAVSWAGDLADEPSEYSGGYYDVSWFIMQGFQPDDSGLYRLKITGGILDPAYSSNYARITFDSNPG